MTQNYGERGPRRSPLALIAVVGGLVVVGAVLAIIQFNRSSQQTEAFAWTVDGPPCPAAAASVFHDLSIDTPGPFDFRGLKGEMAAGDVNCDEITYDNGRQVPPFPVCQFSSPLALNVVTAAGEAWFKPGVGQPVSLSLPNGKLRCVIGQKKDD